MSKTIDYYLAANSPWTYLGHERLQAIARDAGATIRVKPVDLASQIFPASGGLPLPKRAPQRQAYRLVELKRFQQFLKIPLHIEPRFFPVNATLASLLITAAQMQLGDPAAMQLAGAVLKAVWAEEKNIADDTTLASLLEQCGLPATLQGDAQSAQVAAQYQRFTDEALACGVFGAPSYVIDGEIYWGQDRLDFVQRRLSQP